MVGCFWNVHNHTFVSSEWMVITEGGMYCMSGHAEVVKILVSAGAHINDQNRVSSTSPAQ